MASAATIEFLDQLRIRGVEIWLEDERLRYSAPKGVMNDDVLGELRKRKTEIIQQLQTQQKPADTKEITPVPRDGVLPLSFAQQRIWFLDELEPENPFYNVALAKRITGTVNTELLRKALLQLIQRHEVLRSTCINSDDGPQLLITPAAEIDPDGDWLAVEKLATDTSDAELERQVNAEVSPALPLNSLPLIRTRLLQRSADAVLAFTTHHFVVDGWSCGILMRELSELYAALHENRAPILPELTIQYADFASWQNQWLKGPQLQEQLDYWEAQLDGLATLNLPTDKPRPPVQTYRGDIHHFTLPTTTGQTLKELSRQEGMTLYMTLLAAFQVLLHRYSQQDEIVFGTAVSNRHSSALETLLGPFVNTLVLRGDLSGNPSFRELMHRARDVAAGAFSHQDLPFELLVEHLKPERDRSRTPLFQILFVVHQYSGSEELSLSGTDTVDYPVAPGTTMYDLFLQLIEMENSFSGSIEYSTDLFTRETIERMTSHFATLLAGIAANPDASIMDIPMMDASEAQQIVAWNTTAMDYPAEQRLEQLFATQATRTPDEIAVSCTGNDISYGNLNKAANQLAHYLAGKNIGKGDLIGIYIDRSIDMMVALLGILKAGATYVPLDPLFPPDRIRYMMEDAELKGLVTQSSLVGDIQHQPELVLCMDETLTELNSQPDSDFSHHGNASDLAYVIYTSGSTGKPKGVELAHRGVVNFLTTMAKQPGLNNDDTLVAVTTLSFDIAVLELFLPLLNGARLVIATKEVAGDGQRLAELIEQSNTTVMQATPATWQLLLSANWPGRQGLKVLCGGEALPRELADRLLASGCELWNMYGPTETTIWSSVSKVASTGIITVGRPIGNTQMYVVDEQLRSVPIGVPGELCIAGDGVARGYFKRPGLTAERFVNNPYGSGKLYRTGDLARYRGDGEIECLGRNDNQVKIRGYRMELGEIETVLARHPAVTQAVVAAREDREGDKRLVGYLIADETAISGDDLELWKSEQLEQWRDLWQNAYTEERALDPSFNISGWGSSYTGDPIPAAEMREWVEVTADRINALKAKRILEIGSGTGLVVARVAPHAQRYLATDFSPASIAAIEHLKSTRDDLEAVETHQIAADEITTFADEKFDLIIINSVAQYFPDQKYLLEILRTASTLLDHGGQIFLGDLRALPLLEAYHTSVQLHQAEDSLALTELAERVRQRIELEEELLFDTAFFQHLNTELPRLADVSFDLKRGETRNEMSCFRYDAILTLDTTSDQTEPQRIDWVSNGNLQSVRERLERITGQGLLLTGISDARLQPEMLAINTLATTSSENEASNQPTVADLRRSIATAAAPGLQPEVLYALGRELNLHMQMISTAPGVFNALFTPTGTKIDGRSLLPTRDLTLETSCNNPMQGRIQRSLVPALKDHLRASLPEYMVPAIFALLDKFPLTPNGKIDRKALPAPEQTSTQTYTPPRTPTEHTLVAIWEDLLGIDQIGVLDDFFGLGGHSLLATQLVSRIRDQLSINLPLNTLFDSPTVAGLAEAAETLNWAKGNNEASFDDDADIEELEI